MDLLTFQLGLWGNVLAVLVTILLTGCIIVMFTQKTSPVTATSTAKPRGFFHKIGMVCSLVGALLGADAALFSFSYTNAAKNYVVMVKEVAKEVAARRSEETSSAHSALAQQCEGDEDEVDVDGGFELKLKPFFTLNQTQKPLFTAFSFQEVDEVPNLSNLFSTYSAAFNHARRVLETDTFWWRNSETEKLYLSGTQLAEEGDGFVPEMVVLTSWVLSDPWFTRASSN